MQALHSDCGRKVGASALTTKVPPEELLPEVLILWVLPSFSYILNFRKKCELNLFFLIGTSCIS